MQKRRFWMMLFVIAAACAVLVAYITADKMATDTKAPEIILDMQQIELSVRDPKEVLLQGISARDDRDGDVTDSLVIESIYGITEDHSVTVTYAAFDSSGNVAKAQRQVRYTDYESPHFTLSQPLVFDYGKSFEILSFVGAEDVFDGDIQRRVKATLVSGGISVSEEGSHDVQFRVTNSLGETVQLVLPVEVRAKSDFDATLTLKDYLIYLPRGANFNRQGYLESLDYLDGTVDLTGSIPQEVTVRYDGAVDTNAPGVYVLNYTVSCTTDRKVYTGSSRLLVVVEE